MSDKPVAAGKSSFDLIDPERLLGVLNLQPGDTVLDLAHGPGPRMGIRLDETQLDARVTPYGFTRAGIADARRLYLPAPLHPQGSVMTIRSIIGLITLLALVFATCACNRQKVAPNLQQAVDAAVYMTSERFLSRSSFRHLFPESKPSQFVSYIFSDLGVAEWPMPLDQMEQDQLRSAGIPALPPDVALMAQHPDLGHKQQVVIRADDAAGVVFIEAYQTPVTPPVLIIERKIHPKN